MNTKKEKESVDLFKYLIEVFSSVENDLKPYIVEIISCLAELNMIWNQLDSSHRRVELLIESFIHVKETYTTRKGDKNEQVTSKEENQKKIYNGFLRKEIPSLVIHVNLFIKSLKSLENKIALLKNKKEKLSFAENDFFPEDVRKKSPSLLNWFTQNDQNELIKKRNKVEHRINEVNGIVNFFVENAPSNKDFIRELEKLDKIITEINNSYSKIYEELFPRIKTYIADSKSDTN